MMSCSEVMYQAYYPYLYQRAAAGAAAAPPPVSRGAPPFGSPFGPTAAHQYDRFNVQRLQDAHPSLSQQPSGAGGSALEAAAAAAAAAAHPALSAHPLYLAAGGGGAGSVHSSGGSASPASPTPLRASAAPTAAAGAAKEERPECRAGVDDGGDDDDSQDGDSGSRAQYVSANCVVFTHYRGDAAAVVDEHFSRALDKTTHPKESSPMSTRNFPASFWNSDAYAGGASSGGHHTADLYSDHYHPGAAESAAWYHQYSQHHRAVHDYHHHNMAAQYGSLLLPGSRLHMGSHAPCKAMDWQHPGIESAYSSYPTMSGLEAQVQDSSKDLYWF